MVILGAVFNALTITKPIKELLWQAEILQLEISSTNQSTH